MKRKIYKCMECKYESDGGNDSKIFVQFANKKVLCEECIDSAALVILKTRLQSLGE